MVRRPYIMGASACLLPLVDNLSTGLYQPVPFLLGGGGSVREVGKGGGDYLLCKELYYELVFISY
jgi:hypothetical protein